MASNEESSATNNTTNNNDNISSTSNNEASGSSGGGSWWNSFIKSAKEKSINAIEFMKNDLAEFKTTMTTDTSKLVSQASEQLKETTGASSLLDTLSKSINLNLNLNFLNDDTAEKIVVGGGGGGKKSSLTSDHTNTAMNIHERFKQELRQLQSNENTFLTNPTSTTSDNDYDDWEACFNSDNYKSAISDLLIENSSLRLLYSQLVPAQISNNQFWSRYFFKVNQLEEDYKKRVKLIQKATTNQIETVNKEETLDWDDDESTNEVSPNTNELQTSNNKSQTSSKKSLTTTEETISANTITTNDDAHQSTGAENQSLDLNAHSNEILKSAASSSSQIDVKSIELSLDGQELANKLTDTSAPKITTEDSDEWEKVSDVALNEVNEKKSTTNVEADETLTDSVTETNQQQEESSGEEIESDKPQKQQQQPSTEQQSTNTTSESKTNENKKQAEQDWEDWDE